MWPGWTMGILAAFMAVSGSAFAQGPDGQERVESAEAAYDQGVNLFEAGDFAAAGESFERADELLPARVAMENAIRAHREAGDDRRAATVARALIERDVSARRVARFVPEVAATSFEVTVSCDAPCTITVDGAAERYRTFFFAPDEPHFFQATFETGVRDTASTGAAGEQRTLVFEAPEAGSDETPEVTTVRETTGETQTDDDSGMAVIPLWATLTAAAVTAGLAGVTIWSGLDTNAARADYDSAPTLEKLEDGQSRQSRTNVLLAVTIGMGVVTAAMAVFTDWSLGDEDEEDDSAIRFGVGPMDGGAYASISGRMP